MEWNKEAPTEANKEENAKKIAFLQEWMQRKNIESKYLINHGLWARMPQDIDD